MKSEGRDPTLQGRGSLAVVSKFARVKRLIGEHGHRRTYPPSPPASFIPDVSIPLAGVILWVHRLPDKV